MAAHCKIRLGGIRSLAFHGAVPQEGVVGNAYAMDISMDCPAAMRAAKDDRLEHTADYSVVFGIAREEMARPSRLIENAAYRVARRILDELPVVEAVEVRLEKEAPPLGGDCRAAEVELRLERER